MYLMLRVQQFFDVRSFSNKVYLLNIFLIFPDV